jgi:uncharacterized protein YaaW (UPF0174 family)
MSCYGFNFRALYYLDIEDLLEVVKVIRGDEDAAGIAHDKDVYVRGVIIPFFRRVGKAPKGADKDTVMRYALIYVAKKLGVRYDDWDKAGTDEIVQATRRAFEDALQKRIQKLSEEERQNLYSEARKELAKGATGLGVSLAGGGAVLAGELSGFGIYLATTTGLKAISLALGTTFGWGVYQGAATVLGIILGPIGWTIAGVGIVATGIVAVGKWFGAKDEAKLTLAVIGLVLALGENPFAFLGLPFGASMDEAKRVRNAVMKAIHPDVLRTLLPDLPPWMVSEFDTLVLRTQEAYERIQRMREEETSG